MSLRDELGTAADVADILAYEQRAEMLAAQTAQLAAVRYLRDQVRAQALHVQREKTLQDALFALRRSLPALEKQIEQTPQRAASDILLAEQTLDLVPPEAFATLEWKELAVAVREELDRIIGRLEKRYGPVFIQELAELREAARAVANDERAQTLRVRQEYAEAVRQRAARQYNQALIVVAIIAAGAIIYVIVQALRL